MNRRGFILSFFQRSKRLICVVSLIAVAGPLIGLAAERITILDFSSNVLSQENISQSPSLPTSFSEAVAAG
jgi:hypothetical protein